MGSVLVGQCRDDVCPAVAGDPEAEPPDRPIRADRRRQDVTLASAERRLVEPAEAEERRDRGERREGVGVVGVDQQLADRLVDGRLLGQRIAPLHQDDAVDRGPLHHVALEE